MNEANCADLFWRIHNEHLWFFFRILKLKKFLSEDTHYDEFMVIGQVPAGKLLVRGQENSRKKGPQNGGQTSQIDLGHCHHLHCL